MIEQSKLDNLSSYISKLLRKNFGRGPKSCQTTLYKRHLVVYVRGFVSPMEEVLLGQGETKSVDYARELIIEHLLDEIKGAIQVSLSVEIEEHYHDWNFPNNSGIMIFELGEEVCDAGLELEPTINKKDLEAEIARISRLVQKTPDHINLFPISPTVYLAERKGILIPIEKALFKRGFKDELKYTKDQLEKEYFHKDGRFEAIFNKSVKDIFIDWNFKEDKSMMAFILDR